MLGNRWEYWPVEAFYLPLYPWFGFLALRNAHPCFFSAANPGILAGGMGLESKYATLQKIAPRYLPLTLRVEPHTSAVTVRQRMQERGLAYPLIVKPDIGYRGMLVDRVDNDTELFAHLAAHDVAFLIQEYIDYPEELAIYYHRYPGQEQGTITSLTRKGFLTVTGDGQHTIAQLMAQDDRARRQIDSFRAKAPELLSEVLPYGQSRRIGHIGNHSRGTAFIDVNHLIDADLTAALDRMARPIEGFYCGRFDLRCRSLDDLKQDRHTKVIELNGVCAEPAHMYDASTMSYPRALLALARHWGIISRVARANHRRGVRYLQPLKMIRLIRWWRRYLRQIGY